MLPASHESDGGAATVGNTGAGNGGMVAIVLSWILLALALIFIAALSFVIPNRNAAFMKVFMDFKTELPATTKLVLHIPPLGYYLAGLTLAALCIIPELTLRSKRNAALFNLLVIVLCVITGIGYWVAMFLPMISLIQSVSGNTPP